VPYAQDSGLGTARGVTLERVYDTTADDLWDAVTNGERLPRWFAPVSGELKLGGRYQIEGNASGTITACDAPVALDLTWEFGGGVSWVEVRISDEGPERARLTLCHISILDDDFWPKFGPGAVGAGWDLGLLGLALHLSGEMKERMKEEELLTSPEGKEMVRFYSDDWSRAAIESGEDPAQARAAAERTRAAYTGEAPPES